MEPERTLDHVFPGLIGDGPVRTYTTSSGCVYVPEAAPFVIKAYRDAVPYDRERRFRALLARAGILVPAAEELGRVSNGWWALRLENVRRDAPRPSYDDLAPVSAAALVRDAHVALRDATGRMLIHGDLHVSNFFRKGGAWGLMDFASARVGTVEDDAAALLLDAPPAWREAFLGAYGPMDQRLLDVGTAWQLRERLANGTGLSDAKRGAYRAILAALGGVPEFQDG